MVSRVISNVRLLLTLVVSKVRWNVRLLLTLVVSKVRWNVRLLLTLVVSRVRWNVRLLLTLVVSRGKVKRSAMQAATPAVTSWRPRLGCRSELTCNRQTFFTFCVSRGGIQRERKG